MLPGYNTDVQHQGASYHIQTEDNGEANPTIVTLIYMGGAILSHKKTDYRHLLDKSDRREEVRKLMHDQHRLMIRMIMEGRLEAHLQSQSGVEEGEVPPCDLDEEIMKFLSDLGD